MQAISRVASNLCCGLSIPGGHNHTPRTTSDTLVNLNKRYNHMSENQQPNICYTLAMHAGVAGNTLSKEAEAEVAKSENLNYSPRYQQLMGINATNHSRHFDANAITESGVLNFRDNGTERLSHTAYLHRDPSGALTLMHNNGMSLDQALMARGMPIGEQHGGMMVYHLDQDRLQNLQGYLDNGRTFHFSPASLINEQART